MLTMWPLSPKTSSGNTRIMTEPKRNEIVSRWRAGESIRQIARSLGLARNTVSQVLSQVQAQRAGAGSSARRRPSRLDPYEPVIQELLARYPELTAVRLLGGAAATRASPAATPWSASGCASFAPARHLPP